MTDPLPLQFASPSRFRRTRTHIDIQPSTCSKPSKCCCEVCRFDNYVIRECSVSESTPSGEVTRSCSVASTASFSTNSSASNLPGPGRILDNWLGMLGRKMESQAAKKAHALGLGPLAIQIRLLKSFDSAIACSRMDKTLEKSKKKMLKDCFKLLKYMDKYAHEIDPHVQVG